MQDTAEAIKRNDWFDLSKPKLKPKVRLFCFPYAGGGGVIFRSWPEMLPDFIEVRPVHLPGRGRRFKERPYTDMSLLVEHVAEAMAPLLDVPIAFFGHSLGATISFDLAHKLREDLHIQPLHLFVSGQRAPHIPRRNAVTYNLDDDQFINELKRLNGTPREAFEHPELIRLMLGTLRADFQLSETYQRGDKPLLTCPITAFGGFEDEDTPVEEVREWRQETTASFNLEILPGDHFFLHTAESALLRILLRQISLSIGAGR